MKKTTFLTAGLFALSCGALYAAPADEIISEEPAGRVQWYSCEAHAYYPNMQWGFQDHQNVDGVARKTVFSEDGKTLWIRNPISNFVNGSWVKADVDGETITLPLGQVIAVTQSKPDANGETHDLVWTIGAMESEQVYDEEWKEYRTVWNNLDVNSLTFSYKDGVISQVGENIMLALMNDGEFMLYGDVDVTMMPINPEAEIVRFPENPELENWTMSYGFTNKAGHTIETCMVDDTVYLRGFWEESASATIKGEIKDGTLTIPSSQYLGFTNKNGVDYFVYFMSCEDGAVAYVPQYQPLNEPLVFTIDETTGKMIQDPSNALSIIIKGGKSTNLEISKSVAFLVLDNPEFKVESGEIGTPQAPSLDQAFCYRYFPGTTMPFTQLEFTLLPFDEEGTALNAEDLRYVIWVDGERVEFKEGEFPNWKDIIEPMTEVPLDFKNGWGIEIDGTYVRRVQVPYADPEKLGAQMIYIDPVTKEHKGSMIAYYYPDTKEIKYEVPTSSSGVKDVVADAVNEEYYDLLGNRVASDYHGVCVKVVRFSDGTAKSNKVIR